MASVTLDNISSLLDTHLGVFFDLKLSSQTDNLKTSIAEEIENELSKELEPTIRVIDKLSQRLTHMEEQLNVSERTKNRAVEKNSKENYRSEYHSGRRKYHTFSSKQRRHKNYSDPSSPG